MYVLTEGRNYFSMLPFALMILAAALAVLWFRKRSLSYLLFAAVFGIYLIFAADALFFPIRPAFDEPLNVQALLRMINLVPFNYDFDFIPHIVWQQIFYNTLLTVPFGFGVSFVARLKPRHFLWIVPVVGFSTELGQFLIAVVTRFYRAIDISDVILNGLGVLIGYVLFRIFAWFYMRGADRFGAPRWGLFGYVYDVAGSADGSSEERLQEPAAL
jgi:glycopeptide antibiotics resistance protein